MTPEARVKNHIKDRLKILKEKYHLYYHMPVMNGMGMPTVDFNPVVLRGWMCAIEAKAPGEDLTPRQAQTKQDVEFAGGSFFMIDDSLESWAKFDAWAVHAIANPQLRRC